MATTPTNKPIPSEDPRDLKFNAGKIDEVVTSDAHYYTDRFGVRRWTIAGFQYTAEEAIRNYGYITMDSFEDGATLTLPNQVLRYEATGEYYRWDGDFPKIVPAGSTPDSTGEVKLGAWVSVGDASLRANLSESGGAGLIGTLNGMTVQEIIDRGTIYIDDLPGIKTDGSADCAAAINDLLNQIRTITGRRWVVRIFGTRGATYRLDSTIDTTGISNLEFDFGMATVLDNVQGVLTTGRSNHTFLVYNNKSVKIKNIIYTVSPTRSNNVSVTDISTCPFWIGGQYLGDEETIGTVIENFYAVNASLDKGMVAAVVGETRDFHLKNFFISGGSWRFGVNIEWGTAPVDPSTDETDTNGRHPHDGVIESFNGEKLGSMEGFLRTAAAYNIKFLNCNGVDVKAFIYLYSGDKGISRCSNSITFENCKGRLTSFTSGVTNLVHIRYIDNLNGTPLPAYINNEAFIHFLNCEFVGNLSNPTACVRLIGNKGRTKFENCAFRGAYHGINADNNADVTYAQRMSLELSGCTFSNNFIHLRIAKLTGYRVSQCKFLAQASTATTYGVVIGSAANFGVFDGNYFSGANAQPHVGVSNGLNNKFYNNVFIPYNATTPQIDTDVVVYGQNNYYSGGILLRGGLTDKRMIGEPSTGVKSVDLIVENFVSFESADFLTSSATATVNAIVGGVNGGIVRFRGVAVGSSVTFQHAASGVSLGSRLVLKSGSNLTATGNAWSMMFIHTDNGWYEM